MGSKDIFSKEAGESGLKESDLTKEYILEHLSYDRETGLFLWRRDPKNQNRSGMVAGWSCERGYVRIEILGGVFRAHRIAFFLENGYFPKFVDHINRVKNDNRPENLRDAKSKGNARNKGKNRMNTSGYKGVGFDKGSGKWRARIVGPDGKRKCLGRYSSKLEASLAYEREAEELHGEFYYKASL